MLVASWMFSLRPMPAADHTVAITLVNDELPEPTEWLTVTLANPAGAVLGTPAHTRVYILDHDPQPPVFHHLYLPVLLRP